MIERYANKKLLVLGGKPTGSTDIVKYAKSMGAYVIVTDYLDQDASPAKQLADESWLVSTDDVDTLARLARENGVDLVFTAVHEFNISKTIELAERLELPFYASRDQWENCANKDRFKKLCMDFDIPVTRAYDGFDINDLKASDHIEYPVIMKPVDSSGGRGVYICIDADELEKNYEKSLIFSKRQKVLVERYVSAEEVAIYYIVQDGEIILSMMADRCVKHFCKGVIPLPYIFKFPSKHLDLYQKTMDCKVKEMFKFIGIKNGTFFIQSFCDGNQFTFYEMGYRINGSLYYKIMAEIKGLNPLEMLVDHAMSGKMHERQLKGLINPKHDKKAAILNVIVNPGEVGKIVGLDEVSLLNGVFDLMVIHKEGTRILEEHIGTLKQIALRVYTIADTEKELQDLADKIRNTIRIWSTEGENMLL
ncbi:MAG: ATP-grasp domain-containing protein [Eubacteriales bacterium]|nr:ATP-grasp domain-containing protein [Eubacteriales bacterium]